MAFERNLASQFSIWIPVGNEDLEAEYLIAAEQAQHYIQKMLSGEISPDELVEGMEDFLPVPVESYIDEVSRNLANMGNDWGVLLID